MIASVVVLSLVGLAIYVGSKSLSGFQLACVLGFLAVGIAMVVSPAFAEDLAHIFGIGRGSDLILYFGFILQLFLAANYYFRLKRLEAMIIAIARAQAIAQSVPGPVAMDEIAD